VAGGVGDADNRWWVAAAAVLALNSGNKKLDKAVVGEEEESERLGLIFCDFTWLKSDSNPSKFAWLSFIH